jgi:hydroxypyruvate isomerase
MPLTDLPNMSYSYGPIYSPTEQTTDNSLMYNTMSTTMNLMTDSFETASKHLVSEPVNSLEYSRYYTERDSYAQSFDQQILIKQLQLQNSLERNFFDF